MFCRFCACLALAWPLASAAQPLSAAPDPADPKAIVPAVRYESAFAGYRGFEEQKLAPWRALNDQVRSTGTTATAGASGRGAAAPASREAPELNVRKPTGEHRH